MPAYASDGKVVCFFQSAQKFKARYATLGFSGGELRATGKRGRRRASPDIHEQRETTIRFMMFIKHPEV